MQKSRVDAILDDIRETTCLDALQLAHKIGLAIIAYASQVDDDQLRLSGHRIRHLANRRSRALQGNPYVRPNGVVDFPRPRAK